MLNLVIIFCDRIQFNSYLNSAVKLLAIEAAQLYGLDGIVDVVKSSFK